MISLAIYLLKVTLISGILFGYYALALRNERFHQWNRYYLLLSAIISLLLPFAQWSELFSGYDASEPVYVARLHSFPFVVQASESVSSARGLHWIQWAGIIYALFALSLIAGIVKGLLKVHHRIREGEKQNFTFFTLVWNRLNESPFSFFRFIFWNEEIVLESKEGKHILQHELVHVRDKHSVDKLLMEIILALFWINPFFYLMRRELHIIHEFIADQKACQAEEKQTYATLLVKQALRTNNIVFASHFFQKQLRRRVHMLIRENKNSFTWLRRVMAVPIALTVMLFFVFLQSQAKEENFSLLNKAHKVIEKTVTLSNISDKKSNEINSGLHTTIAEEPVRSSENKNLLSPPPEKPVIKAIDHHNLNTENQRSLTDIGIKPNKVFTFVEQMPKFPGGESALMKYLHDHIRYPKVARENGIQGTVVVQFIVNITGDLSYVTAVGPKKGGGLEMEAINVVKNMPDWLPGKQNGRSVTVQYSLPIRFRLENQDTRIRQSPTQPPPPPPPAPNPPSEKNSDGRIFTFVKLMPQFPGGEKSLMKYLHDHIRYPKVARENGIQGTVVIQFIVNVDGSLSQIHTIGAKRGGGLEEEAMRVVKIMPDWQPGMQSGKKVPVQYSLPVRFVLQ